MTAARAALRAAPATAAAVALVATASWVALVVSGGSFGMGAPAFVAAWTLMMVAMMLPSAAPLVLLYARRGRAELLAAGYLSTWAALGIPIYALTEAFDLMMAPSGVAAAVLVAAGVYQLTPLKDACLRQCRGPVDFLVARWGRSAFRIGVEHGAYCVGCCWALMAVLVVAAAMDLRWAAAIAAVVAAEKLLPRGRLLARLGGVALVVLRVLIIV